MLKSIICFLLNHKFGAWKHDGGCGVVTTFEYDYRVCKRCGASEMINYIEKNYLEERLNSPEVKYKQDGDGKIFTDYDREVKWIAEVTIDNAKGVVNIMNKYRNKCIEVEKYVESLRQVINEVHSWAVCSCITTAEDMMNNIDRIVEITKPISTNVNDGGMILAPCVWSNDGKECHDSIITSCGKTPHFEEDVTKEYLSSMGYTYCPYCGKSIIVQTIRD